MPSSSDSSRSPSPKHHNSKKGPESGPIPNLAPNHQQTWPQITSNCRIPMSSRIPMSIRLPRPMQPQWGTIPKWVPDRDNTRPITSKMGTTNAATHNCHRPPITTSKITPTIGEPPNSSAASFA
ncbi:hypothetical protein SLE2022_080600 [Rubroshorea leprosula]